MGDVRELIERLEKATGPDRELDNLIDHALFLRQDVRWELPPYTASIDAALALVEKVKPGLGFMLRRHETALGVRTTCCSLLAPADSKLGDTFDVWSDTTPIAILIALLRSLSPADGGRDG